MPTIVDLYVFLRKEKVSLASASIMHALQHESLLVSEIARNLDVIDASITMKIKELEKRNMVKRVHCAEDRRKVHVSLMAKGRNFVERLQKL